MVIIVHEDQDRISPSGHDYECPNLERQERIVLEIRCVQCEG